MKGIEIAIILNMLSLLEFDCFFFFLIFLCLNVLLLKLQIMPLSCRIIFPFIYLIKAFLMLKDTAINI